MTASSLNRAESARRNHQRARIAHWDQVARNTDHWRGWGGYYHQRLTEIYQFLVAPNQKVIELGCARGDLLASVKPSCGVGIDFSGEMIKRARQRWPHLHFILSDVHHIGLNEKFDVIIISDLLNDLWDVQAVFEQILPLTKPRTRVIINNYSRLWEQPLALAERLGLAKPTLRQNWLTVEDITNLLCLTGFETIRHWPEILWPLRTPLLDALFNRFLVKIWPFRALGLTNFMIARPQPKSLTEEPLVSVIIPARNEEGNVQHIFARTPTMGQETELIFVEGHSWDNTYSMIEQHIAGHPERPCILLKQSGVGKGDAVRQGFAQASGDILMILDADLTVPPEDLPRFYAALCSGKGEFVNGVRLVYPMEEQAMRFVNLLGNKFFSVAFSWLLGQPIKDTLCGTKVLWKSDYDLIAANRAYFGDFDPFGDFDLLFGAARLNLKIVDLPIRYRVRTYGTTNIHRWRHGLLLLKMVRFAAGRIKFV